MDVGARPRYRQDEEERLRRKISEEETSIGPYSRGLLDKLYDLGGLLIEQGRYKTAEDMIRRLVKNHESQSADSADRLDKPKALNLLGRVLTEQGLYVKAERLYRGTVQEIEKMLGPEHPETLTSVNNPGTVLSSQGKYEEAEAMHQRVLEARGIILS